MTHSRVLGYPIHSAFWLKCERCTAVRGTSLVLVRRNATSVKEHEASEQHRQALQTIEDHSGDLTPTRLSQRVTLTFHCDIHTDHLSAEAANECNRLRALAEHPDTDEHRAGCTHCQQVYDSKLPDLKLDGVLSPRECATVLHGLRLIQCEGRIEGCAAGDCEHFEDHEALTNDEIDTLAERINLGWINATVDRMASPQSKTWTHLNAALDALDNLRELIAEAHDTHIFAPGDQHDAADCEYCTAMREAVLVSAAAKADLTAQGAEPDAERARRG